MIDFSNEIMGLKLQSPFLLKINQKCLELDESLLKYIGACIMPPLLQEIVEEEFDRISFLAKKMNISSHLSNHYRVDQYFTQIIELQSKYHLPVFAGIDGNNVGNYVDFCFLLQKLNVNVLFLNIFLFPDDKDFRSIDYEKIYFEMAAKIAYSIEIPILINLPLQFTNIFYIIDQLSYRGVQGFLPILPNYSIDIDIDSFEFIQPFEQNYSLNMYQQMKWIYYLSSFFHKSDFIALATNQQFHSTRSSIKFFLAGAKAIIISYDELILLLDHIKAIETWMISNGFNAVDHFLGQMNFQKYIRPSNAERNEYIKLLHNYKQ